MWSSYVANVTLSIPDSYFNLENIQFEWVLVTGILRKIIFCGSEHGAFILVCERVKILYAGALTASWWQQMVC